MEEEQYLFTTGNYPYFKERVQEHIGEGLPNKFNRCQINVSGIGDHSQILIHYKGKPCYIKKVEYELLKKEIGDLDKILVISYVMGLLSPFGLEDNKYGEKPMDGYEVHILTKTLSEK